MSSQNGKVTLLEARKRTGLSREKVAREIDISSKTLERWEQKGTSKRYMVERLAELYGVSIDDIDYQAAAA